MIKALLFFSISASSALANASASPFKGRAKKLTAIAYKNPNVESNILFIHGTPGSREAFSFYIHNKELRKKASMISVDRIGFGKFHTEAETSLEVHSISILKTAKDILGDKKIVCVGHSYGATLCLDLIARFPKNFETAFLIAGGFNPDRKILRWYNYLAAAWPFRTMLPVFLTNSNKEMLGLKKELIQLKRKFDQIEASVIIVHGLKDQIVPHDDSVWLLEKLKSNGVVASLSTYKSDGHFIIWKQEEKIKDDILQQL